MKKIALFYILNKAENLKISVCKIIKEYYKKKYKIFVSSHSNDLIDELNNLLWTFEQISFIPHCTTKNYDKNSPILLSGKDSFQKTINLKEYDVWLNLDNKMEEALLNDEERKMMNAIKGQLQASLGGKLGGGNVRMIMM